MLDWMYALHSMVPTETDFARAVARPREVVQDLFGTWLLLIPAACGNLPATVQATERHYQELFHDAERRQRVGPSAHQIPFLHASNLDTLLQHAQTPEGRNNGVLVRWVCMVQDTGVRRSYSPSLVVNSF